VKNELVGEECEGLQLFPAESRLVDSSNQYHLYVIEKPGLMFPVGYQERLVSEAEVDGSRQRPFEEKPPDLISQERMERIRAAYDKLPGEPVKGPN
jgi:hypothetical protein